MENLENATLHVDWDADGRTFRKEFPLTGITTHGGLTVMPLFENRAGGTLFTLTLVPSVRLVLRKLSIRFIPGVDRNARMMLNGYQSWTRSRESDESYRQTPIRSLVYPVLSGYGDYRWKRVRRGRRYSWSYTSFRTDSGTRFVGSVDESFAFTVFDYRLRDSTLFIDKDLERLEVETECTPFRIFSAEGTETGVWDGYASFFKVDSSRMKRRTGWTSWYSLYTGISEEAIREHLEAVQATGLPFDVFQIDDGYQHAVGDWLEPNERFPNGMKPVADAIRNAGFIPGLWIAPFVCEKRSHVFRDHPDWILRSGSGRPVHAGFNDRWSGFFYALDPECAGVRDYLRRVFETVLGDWGFEMVKLDFLYAACLSSRSTETRGRAMSSAMEFLRGLTGERFVLGCGVPLHTAAGTTDYCRIGSDVGPFWEDGFLQAVRYRERVSTINSLSSTLSRWQLSGRWFGNDPDVFILRDGGNRMSMVQRKTLFLVNNLLGRLVFFSDNPTEYSLGQRAILDSMFPVQDPQILGVFRDGELYTIHAACGDGRYTAFVNTGETVRDPYIDGTLFSVDYGLLETGASVKLPPYGSVCFLRLTGMDRTVPFLLGTTHVLPGSDVESWSSEDGGLRIRLRPGTPESGTAYFFLPEGIEELQVNGAPFRRSFPGIVTVPYRSL